MKNLWTPWRMAYIEGRYNKTKGCIFDVIPENGTYDKENLLLLHTPLIAVFMNRFPYANGHLLVAPTRHVSDISDLSTDENSALMIMLSKCVAILRAHLKPDGFNIGLNLGETAGAGIASHLHFHIVPRWEGDHNFITVLGEIRTIPEHIERSFDKLLPDFQKISS